MCFILVFLLLVFLIVFVQNDVNVTDSGIIPWTKGDFAITFYVTLNNFGNRPVVVVAEMIKCCEEITDTDIDCDHFHLIGSNMDLEARCTKNITLLYLNIYSYNRRGKCDIQISIIFNSIRHLISTVVHQINFDTSLMESNFYSFLPDYFINHLGSSKIKCDSPDEDPLDSCLPVNCHVKYSGYRGFYRTSQKKCVEIPKCQSNNHSIQAYLWSSNQCVDLNNSVTDKDIEEVLYRIEHNESDEQSRTVDNIPSSQIVRCHNGHYNNDTDLCDCDYGWESEEDEYWDDFIPSTIPIHMCTVHKKKICKNFIENFTNFIAIENLTTREIIYSVLISCVIIVLMAYFIYYLIVITDSESDFEYARLL